MRKTMICNIWNVDFGSAAHIKTPNEKHILLDAGKNKNGFSPACHIRDKYNISHINLFILSHPHLDHLHDIEEIKNNFTIETISRNKNIPHDLVDYSSYTQLKEWKKLNDSYTTPVSDNDYGNISINCYSPRKEWLTNGCENLNNYSMLTTIKYYNTMIIFPGDLEPDGWDALLDNTNLVDELDATYKILIAPHHGRKSAVRRGNTPYTRFLSGIDPDLTIISDKYGVQHTEETLYRNYSKGLLTIQNNYYYEKKVITTKINNCITIECSDDISYPSVYISSKGQ